MKTKAVRIHGKKDLRIDEITLPEVGPDDVQIRVVSDSVCMSTYKAVIEGGDHRRVPDDVENNPTIVGHEFCGDIVAVGENWKHKYKVGDKFVIQPAHYYKGSLKAPGYSYNFCGGNTQYANVPIETLLCDCLLTFNSDVYYQGSLAEPICCVVGAFNAMYHSKPGTYVHDMGIKEGGKMALVASTGPMGLGAIDYAIHGDRRPSLLVVTGTNEGRLARAASIYTVEEAARCGVELHYVNTKKEKDPAAALRAITGGTGYDDVICFAPVEHLVELSDDILGFDGCLNFFAGPTDRNFKANFNWFNVHYQYTHVVANSGGNNQDLRDAVKIMSEGRVNPASLITHIGGLNAVVDTVLNLPELPGGKKLIYNHIDMPLTAIADFGTLGETNPMFAELDRLCKANNGLWNPEAEKYLLANAKKI